MPIKSHPLPKSLAQTNFRPAADVIRRRKRLVMAVDGLEKQGKSHFALTAPAPIAVVNFDIGLEGVVDKFAGKEVYVSDYRIDPGKTPEETSKNADDMWRKFMVDYTTALRHMRSVALDTATELWELLRLARFGRLTQVMPHHYGPVNAEYRKMLKMAYDSDCNLILLHKRKAEYENYVVEGKDKSRKTGNIIRAGFGDTGFLVQANTICFRDETGFNLQIVDCRQNPDLAGEVIPQPMMDFPQVAQLIMPETSEEDWA